MHNHKNKYSLNALMLVFLFINAALMSCKKQNDWLDVKANKADAIPSTLADFQAILDNDGYMNSNYPSLGMVGSDNYYVDYSTWQSANTATERNAYIWASVIFNGEQNIDWNDSYEIVEYANIVLEGIQAIKPDATNLTEWNNLKGSALFYRAFAFYNLVQLYAKPYSEASSPTDLGIPLRMTSDVNQKSVRATVKETYDQIIQDLKIAENLVPATPAYQTRPSKPAVMALLSKTYLNMKDYANAEAYSDSTLQLYNQLLDFNSLSFNNNSYPFPRYPENREIIFYAGTSLYGLVYNGYIDTTILRSYDPDDLRFAAFAHPRGNSFRFLGMYTGTYSPFGGLATDEIYFIHAETSARNGKVSSAIADLNTVLSKRWKTGTYIPYTVSDQDSAIGLILREKRKELPFTANTRWEDLRRLNTDPKYAITLTRILNGKVYTLPPNDNRYTYPIPDQEIRLSGIQQNPR